MWTINSTGEEEWLVALDGQLLVDPLRDEIVTSVLIVGCIQWPPVGFDVLPRSTARQVQGALIRIQCAREWVFGLRFWEVIVPRGRINKIVQQLARAGGMIAMLGKRLRYDFRIRQDLAHLLAVAVQPGAMRRTPGEDCRA